MSAVLVNSGRILLAKAIKPRPAFFGIGSGDEAWGEDEPPATEMDRLEMLSPIGFKQAHAVNYVTPDADGELVLSNGTYAFSDTPTNHLNYQLRLNYGEVEDAIREIHVYVDTTVDDSLPAGQRYFDESHITSLGNLLLVERRKPLHFDGTIGAEINMVVTF